MRSRCIFIAISTVALQLAVATAADYPCRWVFVTRGIRNDQDIEYLRKIADTSARHGLNGMVLGAGWEHLDGQNADYFKRLEQVKRLFAERGVEIIPMAFSAGYGGAVLGDDPNLAEGLPVTNARFVVQGSEARLKTDFPVKIPNGGFEDYVGNTARGAAFHDQPGKVSFIDTQVVKEGKASLRFENFGPTPHGHGRVMFQVPVRPHRCYRVAFYVKTEGIRPDGAFRAIVLVGDRPLAWDGVHVAPTGGWQKIVLGFNSLDYDKVNLCAGMWGGKGGRCWLDDFTIEEVGLINVLRRPGTPVVVRDAAAGTEYQEGRDFARIVDPRLADFRVDHPAPVIRLMPGSRIRDGQTLRVDYYHGPMGQVSVCMSEPKLYELWGRQIESIQKHLAPKRWLLSMDEIRAGGSCKACKDRKMSMAQILGDCLTRQFEMIRRGNPEAEVFVWDDMLDPNCNAHGNYYLVDGDYTGAWNYVPKEMRMVCWDYAHCKAGLSHFSRLGFKTLGAAYYDTHSLDNSKGWLKALGQTPGALGVMYTTWQDDYDLLGPFGDLLSSWSKRPRP